MSVHSGDRLNNRARPTGGPEVSAAIVEAATRLFAENDPGAVTLREIAERANVNYGLIHRHVGTKVDLVAAVVRRHSLHFEPSDQARSDARALMVEMATHYLNEPAVARALAWAALNGASPESLVAELTDVSELVHQLEARTPDASAARRLFAFAAAAVLGITVFGEIGLVAANLEEPRDHLDELEDTALSLLGQLIDSL